MLTLLTGALARSRMGPAISSNFSRVMLERKSMSFMRHSTLRGASGMLLSTFFSCRRVDRHRTQLPRFSCRHTRTFTR